MAELSKLPPWTDARTIRDQLAADNWRSPDTYDSRIYAPIDMEPAVYLFLTYRGQANNDYRTAFVAYVGMATRLENRMVGHEILSELAALDAWVMRWFKPTDKATLRAAEKFYIGMYDPPWNIIGRNRGVAVT